MKWQHPFDNDRKYPLWVVFASLGAGLLIGWLLDYFCVLD